MNKEDKFMTYEYTTIYIKKNMEAIYVDTYKSFGWELIENEIAIDLHGLLSSKLSFKRNRKINNKAAINKLQKKMDVHFKNIDKLEAKKTIDASIKAYIIGLLACTFLALSVFMITGYIALGSMTLPLQIILGAIGIILCIPPYFVYRNTITVKTEQINPLIEEQYDKISDLCEEAHLLIK